MRKNILLFFIVLVSLTVYGGDYKPSEDSYQSNNIESDTSLPFGLDDDIQENEYICPSEDFLNEDIDTSMVDLVPPPPRYNSKWLCLAQSYRRGRKNLFYAFGLNRMHAVKKVLKRCRRTTRSRCRLYWCGRVNQ